MPKDKDVIGQAIIEYSKKANSDEITVSSDICEDDTIPVNYLFRSYAEMPRIEQIALDRCSGKVLDIGAAAGIHSMYLKKKGINVKAIDISHGAVAYLTSQGINAEVIDFLKIEDDQYDTLLLLMNGIGIAGDLNSLESFLQHTKKLLAPNGKILCDSTDVNYLYEDEDGSMWIDLNSEYYGNFRFQMKYKDIETDWFNWLYVDFDKLKITAEKVGLAIEKIYEEEYQFLVELTHS